MISTRGVTTTVSGPSRPWTAAMIRLLPEPVGAASSRFSPGPAARRKSTAKSTATC